MIEQVLQLRREQIQASLLAGFADDLEKGGKPAQLGERRQFAGKWYKKIVGGWRLIAKGSSEHPDHPDFKHTQDPTPVADPVVKPVEPVAPPKAGKAKAEALTGGTGWEPKADWEYKGPERTVSKDPSDVASANAQFQYSNWSRALAAEIAADQGEYTRTEFLDHMRPDVRKTFNYVATELEKKLPAGHELRWRNPLDWADHNAQISADGKQATITIDATYSCSAPLRKEGPQKAADRTVAQLYRELEVASIARRDEKKLKNVARSNSSLALPAALRKELEDNGCTVNSALATDDHFDVALMTKALTRLVALKKKYAPGRKLKVNVNIGKGDDSPTIMQAGNDINGLYLKINLRSHGGRVNQFADNEEHFNKIADTKEGGFHPKRQQSHVEDYITHEFTHLMQVSEPWVMGNLRMDNLRGEVSKEDAEHSVSEYAKTIYAEREAEAFVLYANGDRSEKTMHSLKDFLEANKHRIK